MNFNDSQTSTSNPVARLFHAWVTAFVAQYETPVNATSPVDASTRLRWTPVA